ncbi:MAG: RnfH family protein [Alcaligenaceae bacterium]|nr:RnfH family protein [Alcaligenaceae bacterium]
MMRIELLFAAPDQVWRQTLELPEGVTAGDALAASDFSRLFPEYADPAPPIGIYGERCAPGRVLMPDDRVEIYRSLVFDPLESRRRRAQHKAQQSGQLSRD